MSWKTETDWAWVAFIVMVFGSMAATTIWGAPDGNKIEECGSACAKSGQAMSSYSNQTGCVCGRTSADGGAP
jgi:hypothetical protein